MTGSLIVSRRTKNLLHKIYIKEPTALNELKYKKFRNLLNTLVRKSKILYFEQNLKLHEKNPKKHGTYSRKSLVKKRKLQ